MAYDIEQMAIVWVPAHTNVPKGWSYINTDDTLAEIEANGYFDDEARLDLNDSIRVTGSDGTAWLRVSQAPPSEVQVVVDTNAVSSLLDGRLWVGNATNAATAVLMSGDATMDNTGAVTIANDAITTAKILDANVTLAKLAAGIAPSHVVKYAGQPTTAGGNAAEAITVTGAAATDLAFVQMVDDGTNNVTIVDAVVTTNTLTVTFSADPGADCVINYQLLRAAA